MPRAARIVAPGHPHHVTQRGNNRQVVFQTNHDREIYLRHLKEQSDRYELRIDGFCLMPNHVHLIGTPLRENALARAVGRTNYLYANYFNRLHGRSGHLWQNRFYSCLLDEKHFWQAVRYVERNPVRAGLVEMAWQYPWSSAAAHCGGPSHGDLLDMARWVEMAGDTGWPDALNQPQDEATVDELRRRTHTGRPWGGDVFLTRLENTLCRRIRPRPRGRPVKSTIK